MSVQPRNVRRVVVGGALVGFGFDLGPIHVDTDKGVHVDDPGKFIAHVVSDAGKGVASFVKDPAGTSMSIADQAAHFAQDYASNMAGVISLIPGIGTPISSAIEAGLATLAGGSPLSIGIHAAYGLIPIPPGIKSVCDQILDVAIAVGDQLMAGKKLDAAVIDTIIKKVPAGIPFARQVADTLIHLIVSAVTQHETVAPSHAIAAHPKPSPQQLAAALAKTGGKGVMTPFGMAFKPAAPPPRAPVRAPAGPARPVTPPKVIRFHMGPTPAPANVAPVPYSPPPRAPMMVVTPPGGQLSAYEAAYDAANPLPPPEQPSDDGASYDDGGGSYDDGGSDDVSGAPRPLRWVRRLGPDGSYECGWV
jgi:hypothetical protein